jgi:hypothetical protein
MNHSETHSYQAIQTVIGAFLVTNKQKLMDLSDKERGRMARNRTTHPGILAILANDPNSWVRYYVAQNPKTSQEDLTKLANDDSEAVRCMVADNPNTSPELLDLLARQEYYKCWEVRWFVANNTNTSSETLSFLVNISHPSVNCCVRAAAERNPNYNPSICQGPHP